MKQKILYILIMITALIGGNDEAWAQNGYAQKKIEGITYTFNKDALKKGLDNGRITIKHTYSKENISYNTTFTIGDNVNGTDAFGGLQLKKESSNTFQWSTEEHYIISLNKIEIPFYNTITGGKINFTASSGKTKEITGVKNESTQSFDGLDLPNDGYVILKVDYGWSRLFYIRSVTYTYNIFYYELDVSSLESAITTATNALGSITDETMKSYLNTAIANANSFKAECAFPNSYWNGSSVGKTPAEVTETAEKLNAITNYLIARTDANKFEQSKVPNVVYNRLHSYDQYNPNEFDTGNINTATEGIKAAINVANATTVAYQKALSTIASAENSSAMTNDPTTLAADIVKAKTQLEEAISEDGINSALANIKYFDSISFSGSNELQEGASIEKPANAVSSKTISYSSDNLNVIVIDGTTLKAVGAGEVTITASTTTGNGYYGYTTTQTYTVKPNGITLVPNVECNIVENVTYPQITLQRTFSAGLHYTLTLPFDSNISEIGGEYAAQLALITYNQADGYTLYFQKVTNGQMLANQPYVIYLPNGAEKLTWKDVTIVTPNAESIKVNNWTMQGNYIPKLSMEGKYGIAGGKFCLGVQGSTINAYTAYFSFLGTENVRARVAVMDEGGNTTYIGELSDLDGNAAEEVFGIDGMRLPEMRKGINIVRQKDGSVRKIVK